MSSNTQLLVCFDIDQVFADFVTVYCEIAASLGMLVEPGFAETYCTAPLRYSVADALDWTPADTRRVWAEIRSRPHFWRDLEPMPGIGEHIDALQQVCIQHIPFFLTSRMDTVAPTTLLSPDDAGVYSQTAHWLEHHLGVGAPGRRYNLLVTDDKLSMVRALRADVIIDDNPKDLHQFAKVPDLKVFAPPYLYCQGIPGVDYSGLGGLLDYCLRGAQYGL